MAGLLSLVLGCGGLDVSPVGADAATQPAGTNEPEAAALWPHPADPSLSLVLAGHSDRDGGIAVHDLEGSIRQFFGVGDGIRKVDLRADVALGEPGFSLVAAAQVGHRVSKVLFFRIDPEQRQLRALPDVELPTAIPVLQGLCLFHEPQSGRVFLFLIEEGEEGRIEQWELSGGAGGLFTTLRRSFWIGGASGSCVVDDEQGALFVAEKKRAIWRYDARPSGRTERREVDHVGSDSGLAADIEGLAIYTEPDGRGLLLASSEGNDRIVLYERSAEHAPVGAIQVRAHGTDEPLRGSEGIAVTSSPLGPKFPHGLLVVHDDHGEPEDNLALVGWQKVADALGRPPASAR